MENHLILDMVTVGTSITVQSIFFWWLARSQKKKFDDIKLMLQNFIIGGLAPKVPEDQVYMMGSGKSGTISFSSSGTLTTRPKIITEEREALIEQRGAKESQARDPIFP